MNLETLQNATLPAFGKHRAQRNHTRTPAPLALSQSQIRRSAPAPTECIYTPHSDSSGLLVWRRSTIPLAPVTVSETPSTVARDVSDKVVSSQFAAVPKVASAARAIAPLPTSHDIRARRKGSDMVTPISSASASPSWALQYCATPSTGASSLRSMPYTQSPTQRSAVYGSSSRPLSLEQDCDPVKEASIVAADNGWVGMHNDESWERPLRVQVHMPLYSATHTPYPFSAVRHMAHSAQMWPRISSHGNAQRRMIRPVSHDLLVGRWHGCENDFTVPTMAALRLNVQSPLAQDSDNQSSKRTHDRSDDPAASRAVKAARKGLEANELFVTAGTTSPTEYAESAYQEPPPAIVKIEEMDEQLSEHCAHTQAVTAASSISEQCDALSTTRACHAGSVATVLHHGESLPTSEAAAVSGGCTGEAASRATAASHCLSTKHLVRGTTPEEMRGRPVGLSRVFKQTCVGSRDSAQATRDGVVPVRRTPLDEQASLRDILQSAEDSANQVAHSAPRTRGAHLTLCGAQGLASHSPDESHAGNLQVDETQWTAAMEKRMECFERTVSREILVLERQIQSLQSLVRRE